VTLLGIIQVGRDRWARRFGSSYDSQRRVQRSRPTFAFLFALSLGILSAHAAEVIPPAPRDHFNDYAGIVDRGTAQQLQTELTQFERDTSNQILVAIYPRMQSDSSIEDYTVRVAQAWRVGQAERKNGAVLFIFSEDRKLYVQVGYGLEGTLPDALCKQIIENEIVPRFRNGDFTGGVAAGTRALMAATRGEYQGSGRIAADRNRRDSGFSFGFGTVVAVIILFLILQSFSRRDTLYTRRGRRLSPWIDTGGWGGGGSWGGGSGGWSGGGGGSFSGGGGSFGGGGAGGSW
jgi:uncharacterized protein